MCGGKHQARFGRRDHRPVRTVYMCSLVDQLQSLAGPIPSAEEYNLHS